MADLPFPNHTDRRKRAISAGLARRNAASMRVATRAKRPIDMRAVIGRATSRWPCIRWKIRRVAWSNTLRSRKRGRSRRPLPRPRFARRRRRGGRGASPSRRPKHQRRPLLSKRRARLLRPRAARGRARQISRVLSRRLNSRPPWGLKTRPCRSLTSAGDWTSRRALRRIASRKISAAIDDGREAKRLAFARLAVIADEPRTARQSWSRGSASVRGRKSAVIINLAPFTSRMRVDARVVWVTQPRDHAK